MCLVGRQDVISQDLVDYCWRSKVSMGSTTNIMSGILWSWTEKNMKENSQIPTLHILLLPKINLACPCFMEIFVTQLLFFFLCFLPESLFPMPSSVHVLVVLIVKVLLHFPIYLLLHLSSCHPQILLFWFEAKPVPSVTCILCLTEHVLVLQNFLLYSLERRCCSWESINPSFSLNMWNPFVLFFSPVFIIFSLFCLNFVHFGTN